MITLTEKAQTEVRRIAAEQVIPEGEVCLRLKVIGGGCSGFMHHLELDSEYTENDIVEETNGIKVVVDKRSALYTEGVEIDYHEDLNKRGFVVNNPLATTRCGCGSSFNM